jgi:hypothetical protein
MLPEVAVHRAVCSCCLACQSGTAVQQKAG